MLLHAVGSTMLRCADRASRGNKQPTSLPRRIVASVVGVLGLARHLVLITYHTIYHGPHYSITLRKGGLAFGEKHTSVKNQIVFPPIRYSLAENMNGALSGFELFPYYAS